MKLPVQKLITLIPKRNSKREFVYFMRTLQVLFFMVIIFSILFYSLMAYEGKEHSAITCVYWTLTVMTTLGFGDITFTSEIGRLFTIIVLLAGVSIFLVMLPLTFMQYSAWIETQKEKNIPHILSDSIKNHIIIVGISPLSQSLARQLQELGFYCVFLCADLNSATNLVEQDFKVMLGDYDDKTTYHNLGIERATMLLALDSDTKNSNIIFSAREVSSTIKIIARAEEEASRDILAIAGSTQVFLFRQLLALHLAQRVTNHKGCFTFVTAIKSLFMAEVSIKNTSLSGKTLLESDLRTKWGINVVGLWKKGLFFIPQETDILPDNVSLILAGTKKQLEAFNNTIMKNLDKKLKGHTVGTQEPQCGKIVPMHSIDFRHVIVIGAGQVGLNVALTLSEQNMKVTVIDKKTAIEMKKDIHLPTISYLQGDAAQLGVLEKANIENANSIIITTNDDDTNIYLTLRCRQLSPDVQIICRATLDKNVNILYGAGANMVLSLMSLVRNSIINTLIPHKVFMLSEGLSLFRYTVSEALVGKSILDSEIQQKTHCNIVAILGKNGKVTINPEPSYIFLSLDELYIITDREGEVEFDNFYKNRAVASKTKTSA